MPMLAAVKKKIKRSWHYRRDTAGHSRRSETEKDKEKTRLYRSRRWLFSRQTPRLERSSRGQLSEINLGRRSEPTDRQTTAAISKRNVRRATLRLSANVSSGKQADKSGPGTDPTAKK